MREKKFTPGPWKFYAHDVDLFSVDQTNDDPMQICGLCPGDSCATEDHMPSSEREANGNLISAAPELLEALEGCCRICEKDNGINADDCRSGLCNVKTALAKAYGETP